MTRALTTTVLRKYFFFSSRRRHTRFKCDWSSDVCSSDLIMLPQNGIQQCADHKWEEQTQPVGQHEQHCCYDEPPTIGTQERQNAGHRTLSPVTTPATMFFPTTTRRNPCLNFLRSHHSYPFPF